MPDCKESPAFFGSSGKTALVTGQRSLVDAARVYPVIHSCLGTTGRNAKPSAPWH